MTDIASVSPLPLSVAGEFFDKNWKVYQKMLECDYLEHRYLYAQLHEFLAKTFSQEFNVLELGCGDASFSTQALTGTPIAFYQGVDLSQPGLEVARMNLASLGCPFHLIRGNFIDVVPELISTQANSFDVILSSFALHHLQLEEKDRLLGQLFELLKNEGVFILIDVILKAGETRFDYYKRYLEDVKQNWSLITTEEFALIEEHITTSDFPETEKSFHSLAQKYSLQSEVLHLRSNYKDCIFCFYKRSTR